MSAEIVKQLRQVLSRESPEPQNVFLLDGSSLELEHANELLDAYPAARN